MRQVSFSPDKKYYTVNLKADLEINTQIKQQNDYNKIIDLFKLCRKLIASNSQAIQQSTTNIGVKVRGFKNFQKTLTLGEKINTTLNMNYMILKKKNKGHFTYVLYTITS